MIGMLHVTRQQTGGLCFWGKGCKPVEMWATHVYPYDAKACASL